MRRSYRAGERRSYRTDKLSIRLILRWADAHLRRTGAWPSIYSGRVPEAPDETWSGINQALSHGFRGLRGGSSLSRFLKRHRGTSAADYAPKLTIKQILAWADHHHRRTGHWPQVKSGPILAEPEDNWKRIDNALRWGLRGMAPGSSLAKLLDRHRHVRNKKWVPSLFVHEILFWADAHHRRSGHWPKPESGPIVGAPGETWSAINGALVQGTRGQPGGDSLPRFLARYRGVRNKKGLPRLTTAQILRWADAYIHRHGRRPTIKSGAIPECPGETWCTVAKALYRGRRGFRGRTTLAQFLDRHGRINRPARTAARRDRRHRSW